MPWMPVPFSLPLLAALGGDEGAGVRVEVRALEGAVQGVAVGIDAAARDCQDFRVWAGIMGKKESHYVPTQGTGDTG